MTPAERKTIAGARALGLLEVLLRYDLVPASHRATAQNIVDEWYGRTTPIVDKELNNG